MDEKYGSQKNENTIAMAPPGMRLVIAIISIIIAISLAVIIIDKISADGILAISKKETTATIDKVEISRSKNTKAYWISYSFEVGNKKYERTSFFGLIKQGTKILATEADKNTEGTSINIIYSRINPGINQLSNDKFKYDKVIFIIMGIFLFGLLAINEIKPLVKAKKINNYCKQI